MVYYCSFWDFVSLPFLTFRGIEDIFEDKYCSSSGKNINPYNHNKIIIIEFVSIEFLIKISMLGKNWLFSNLIQIAEKIIRFSRKKPFLIKLMVLIARYNSRCDRKIISTPSFRRDRSQIVGAIERNYFFHRSTRCIQLESDKAGSLSATISLLGAVIKFQPSGRTTLPAF